MLSSIFTVSLAQSAIELGCIYALVALALFVSFSILNIADLSTDGCFTLGCAVCAMVTLQGHPFLGLLAAMGAGVASGFVTAFLQTRLGVESILAGIIVNTGLYTINIAVMQMYMELTQMILQSWDFLPPSICLPAKLFSRWQKKPLVATGMRLLQFLLSL